MTWVDNNGIVRPQSWEEYCAMSKHLPAWAMPEQSYQPLRPRTRERVQPIRIRLFRANPHCFWCGRLVRMDVPHASPDLATVDHLYSRLHPKRDDSHREQKGVLHVLACYECNHWRGVCEQQQRPFIPKLKERLEHAQLADATLVPRDVWPNRAQSSGARVVPERAVVPRRICTLKEAAEFARENPSR